MKRFTLVFVCLAISIAMVSVVSATTVEETSWGTIKALYRTPQEVNQGPLFRVGSYNSFPWGWNLPFSGCAWMTCGPSCGYHYGTNYWATDWSGSGAADGKPVLAPASGWVKFAGWSSGSNWAYGNQVIVEAGDTGQGNGNRYICRLSHMNAVNVRAGWWVEKGTVLGWVGHTGQTNGGSHIHFSVHRGSYAGYGGINGDSIPISNCWYPGIDGYNGSGYWCSEF